MDKGKRITNSLVTHPPVRPDQSMYRAQEGMKGDRMKPETGLDQETMKAAIENARYNFRNEAKYWGYM